MMIARAVVRWRYRARRDALATPAFLASRAGPAPVPSRVHERCDVVEREIAGRPVVTLTARDGSRRTGAQVLHLHGGAYVGAIQAAHWLGLAELAVRSGADIHVPRYELAPAGTADDAARFLAAVLAEVAARAPDVPLVLSGDSAGGGLALAAAVRSRHAGSPVSAVLLFSPWLDLAVPDRVDPRLPRRDPMLTVAALRRAGRLWAGARSVDDPLVSPLRAALDGLPPVTILAGGHDLLVEDAERLAERITRAGGACRLAIWPSGFHLFMAARRTPEAGEAMELAVEVLRSC
ncbi:alpha/beta hydrolase fold domain-containing protein [Homoserinibacter sp. YIM 151385]|uniref:alpha/beta hydrolase fold domain-containing protein n=1 Tax=Homoserinibacter sp. YIM 151385 TaxID=2985506 RepID=UPI0022F084F6|nr:alpha/beta hydrolase fold domain-containing protein [Homoserinibacter sp. YIM 151385]WBU37085.1 alpha/beta hydrolase fold domain-containing protein [Homoserinibacter sp. YIM 151385]